MAKQTIDTGTLALNGADGDTNRDAADKINANFTELYNANENFVRGAGVVPGGALVVFAGTTGNQVAAASGGAPGTAAFRNATEFASAAQGAKADNAQAKLSPGDGILIDNTDPLNPIISATATGGGEVATVAGVAPFGGDVPAAELIPALGIDQKLGNTATAVAATKLETARSINGVAFDGTANITVADATKEPAITGGTAGQYWNGLKAWADFASSVRSSVLTGLSLATGTAITAADSVLSALGKLQAQVSGKLGATEKAADSDKLNGQLASFYTATMTGATASVAGVKGLVPAPAAGDQLKFLRADGTWVTVTSSATWGAITGTLSAQTDLQSALDAKVSGSAQQLATAWVNFDGSTGAIRSSFNVSSVTRSAVGTYRVNFITPMANINYAAHTISNVLTATDQGNQAYPVALNIAYIDVVNRINGAFVDRPYYALTIHGGR